MVRAVGWLFGSIIFIGLSLMLALLLASVVCYAAGARGAAPASPAACCSPACTCGCNEGKPCDCTSVATGGSYRWVPTGDADQIAVYRAGIQVGGWRISDQTYHPRFARGVWGEPCACPVPVPSCYCRHRDGEAVVNYGVQSEPATEARPKGWSISGKPVSEAEAKAAITVPTKTLQEIGAPAVPDDAGKPYVLWVGDDATGERIRADAGDKARVQSVAPGHWITQDRDGKPVYGPGLWFVRAADSKAVGHETAYAGPDQLREGLRRCDPAWSPSSVPDLSTPHVSIPSLNVPPIVTHAGLLAGGGLLAGVGLVLARKMKRPTA